MANQFIETFRQPNAPAERGAYLSRIFGIFSEDIVAAWCSDDRSPYENMGRPTVTDMRSAYQGNRRGSTLDFTLRCREDGVLFVAEQKCEIQYENFKCLELNNVAQVDHHSRKSAFRDFLACAEPRAADDTGLVVRVDQREVATQGAILVWVRSASCSRGPRAA